MILLTEDAFVLCTFSRVEYCCGICTVQLVTSLSSGVTGGPLFLCCFFYKKGEWAVWSFNPRSSHGF